MMAPVFTIAMPTSLEKSSSGSNWQSGSTTLITESLAGRVIEIDGSGSIVWQKTGLNAPKDAERLSNGNTLITESGMGRVIEVDNGGNITWEKNGLNDPIDAERLSNGNTLITESGMGRVIEVDSAGNEVWNKTDLYAPKDAERLDNGNTLIVEYTGGRIIEVDNSGNIVWEKTGLLGPIDAERLNNEPPNAPTIDGPKNGKVGVEYKWTFISTDPEEDNITYYIDWADECGGAEWHGPYPSGEEVTIAHTYTYENTFTINTLAVDENGAESNWTYFEVTMPKNKSFNFNFNLLSWLFERFPNAFPILRHLRGL